MNTIKNKCRYVLTDRFGIIDVFPVGEADFKIDYDKEEGGKYFYSRQFQGKFIFTGEIFERLKIILNSIYICTQQRLQVFRPCGNGEALVFDGNFSLLDGDWDDDKCTVGFKFGKNFPFKCLDDNKNNKVNLLQGIQNKVAVKSNTAGGEFQFLANSESLPNSQSPYDPQGYYWTDAANTPESGNWLVIVHSESGAIHYNPSDPYYGDTFTAERSTRGARELVILPAPDTPPAGWVLVQDNTAVDNTKKYAKKVTRFNCQETSSEYQYGAFNIFERCDIVGATGATGATIDNGMRLEDVLKLFLTTYCGTDAVVSDFFQINPENPSTINYVTGEPTFVDEIILYQKSDVKRPNVSSNAAKAEWTFDKLIEVLNKMFNVSYTLENGVLRLEHISWFSRESGLNLTLPKFAQNVKGSRKYSFDNAKLPAQEVFRFKEAHGDGWNSEITYNGACVTGDNVENYVIEELTTDVQYCLANTSSDSDKVEDKGFVMIASRIFNGDHYIVIDNATENARLNNVLSFDNLVKKFHKHNRPLKAGQIKGVNTIFESTRPIKKGEPIVIPLCCDEVFDPNDTITTHLGEGIVEKATYNIKNETLELNLLYDVFENLTSNSPPTFTGGDLTTAANTPITFALNITDGDGTIESVVVLNQAINGTVEILSLTEAKYTPNAGFTGTDFFHLQAFDNWGEPSSATAFTIDIN